MSPVYLMADFGLADAAVAYALVSLAHPRLTLKQWRGFVSALVARNKTSGMKGIKDRRGYWHAVFAYRVERHLAGEKLLRISDMVIGTFVGHDPVAMVMEEIDALTRQHGCDAVVVDIAEWDGGRSDLNSRQRFEKAGFRVNAVSLWRGA